MSQEIEVAQTGLTACACSRRGGSGGGSCCLRRTTTRAASTTTLLSCEIEEVDASIVVSASASGGDRGSTALGAGRGRLAGLSLLLLKILRDALDMFSLLSNNSFAHMHLQSRGTRQHGQG